MIEVTKSILKEVFKKRKRDAKKYDFGLLLVIGGSEFYSGPPAFSAMAGFRTGVDMVRIIAPKRAADIIASFSPNLAAYPLKGSLLTKEHLDILFSMTESAKTATHGKTAVVIGGGMGRTEQVQETILEYLSQISVPAVIDADGIYAIAKKTEIISGKPFIITPHSYEFFVLTGKEIKDLPEKEKVKIVQEEARRLNTTILLKGATDIISNGAETAVSRAGSPVMTVGGTGDVLAGIIGALMAKGIDPFLAGQAGALINGLTGQIAEKRIGEGVVATDLIELIPEVI